MRASHDPELPHATRRAGPWISVGRPALCLIAQLAGFATLLFATRFLARAHLIQQMDQECYPGGIAIDVLTHGIRFPLLAYAPNEYDNHSFFSGLLTALSFSLLGRNVLALKLVTHMISAASAVGMLWLLRGCLQELGLTNRRTRWAATAVMVIAVAFAPRVVTLFSMYALGNHAEGSAINTILLALFACRLHTRSVGRIAGFWALVGFALYVNKGAALVIPVLGAAEIIMAWRSLRRLAAAAGGFILGVLPELLVIVQRRGAGWAVMLSKEERNSQVFPQAFVNTLLFFGEYRPELLLAWGVAIVGGIVLLVRGWRSASRGDVANANSPPLILGLLVGVTCLHLSLLTVMAKNGLDAYVIYAYPTLVLLYSVLVAWVCAYSVRRGGESAGTWVAAVAVVMTLVLYRPDAIVWGFGRVSSLWENQAGAACSWRFAEGFEREQQYGLAPAGQTREQHAIERCRQLTEKDQVLDCIGGIARELAWRHHGQVEDPSSELSEAERQAYAYLYGTHRKGKTAACSDFKSASLQNLCLAAGQTECLVFADLYTRVVSGQHLSRPRCAIAEPPMNGFWAMMRADFFARTDGVPPNLARAWGDDDLTACKPVLDACY